MRFVEVKSIQQQDMQAVHRMRERLTKARTALSNEIRGLLAEYGVIIVYAGIPATQRGVRAAIEEADNGLSHSMRELLCEKSNELTDFNEKIQKCDTKIQRHAQEDERVKRLLDIEGIGPISASAIVTVIGNGTQFKNGRELAASMGLVPSQHSSGGKERLGGISKRGDKRLRTLIIHGARAVIRFCENKTDARSQWVKSLVSRRNKNIATVGLANKNARIIWSLLARNEVYRHAVAIEG